METFSFCFFIWLDRSLYTKYGTATTISIISPPPPHLQNDQKALYKKQFGFQKKFSTAHAVISLIENIEKAIDNKMFVCGVFVDLQKAFDTVDLIAS